MATSKQVTQSAREILGNYLTEVMKNKKINLYQLEKITNKPSHQLKPILTGSDNYTIDTFLTVIQALDLYLFFASKDGKHLDLKDMKNKLDENNPNL